MVIDDPSGDCNGRLNGWIDRLGIITVQINRMINVPVCRAPYRIDPVFTEPCLIADGINLRKTINLRSGPLMLWHLPS